MGDDLDDGLLLDEHLIAQSDDEEALAVPDAVDEATQKKRKRREHAKTQRRKKAAVRQEQSEAALTVAQQPSDIQADFLRTTQRKAFPKLSDLELQETGVPAACMAETYTFERERTLEHMPAFVRQFFPLPDTLSSECGAPHVLVVAGNAQRAADIARVLRVLLPNPKTTHVGKLFARHFKVEEQDAWLCAHVAPLCVGTPHRLQSLMERGSLRLEHTQALVIDYTWRDAKQRTVLETPETCTALLMLLGQRAVRDALQRPRRPCRVALY